MKPFVLILAIAAGTAVPAGAQTPAAPPAAAPAQAAPAPDLPTPPADFTYSRGSRRDPFVSLTKGNTGADVNKANMPIGRGTESIAVDEMSVKGIVLANGGYVAIVAGPGGKTQTYTVKVGTKLHDGTVQSITADAVEVLQQVSDPLSVEKQRRVKKLLRTQEEGK